MNHAQHGVLHARVEQVVVGGQTLARRVGGGPTGPVGADPLQACGGWARLSLEGLQLGQRRGEVQSRNERQVVAVEQAKHQLERILSQRVLSTGKQHARVVARRGLDQRAGIDRAAIGEDRHHHAAIADVAQVFHQPHAALIDGVPIVEAAPPAAGGIEGFRGREVFDEQGAIQVTGPQPGSGLPRRKGRWQRIAPFAARQRQRGKLRMGHAKHRDLAIDGARALPAIGQQQQRRLGLGPEHDAMPSHLRWRVGLFVGNVHTRVEPNWRDRAGSIWFHDADA